MAKGWHLEVLVLPTIGSNKWPININIDINTLAPAKPFRFEIFYLSHPYFVDNIKYWWQETIYVGGTLMYHFQQRIKKIRARLKV